MKSTAYFILIISLIFLTHCRTRRAVHLQKEYRSIYINEFKLTYFRKLLRAGFNNSEAVNSLIEFDRSGFTEPVLTNDDHILIDSIVSLDNLNMTNDSTNSIGRVAEGAEGKHVLGYILERLESKWLDSLAKQRYRIAALRNVSW